MQPDDIIPIKVKLPETKAPEIPLVVEAEEDLKKPVKVKKARATKKAAKSDAEKKPVKRKKPVKKAKEEVEDDGAKSEEAKRDE